MPAVQVASGQGQKKRRYRRVGQPSASSLMSTREERNRVQSTVGGEKVSIMVTRKTEGDLLVSQHSAERWFRTEQAATVAMQRAIDVFIEAEAELGKGIEEAPKEE